jgi:hypothetical protein
MDCLKISADDHIDLGCLPKDLWRPRASSALKDRAPQAEDRDGEEPWFRDGEVWGEYRGETWFAQARRQEALNRSGVGEPLRPTTPAKRLADMDRFRLRIRSAQSAVTPPYCTVSMRRRKPAKI